MRPATPSRFVTRTLLATLSMVAFVLSAALVVVTLSARDHVRQSVVAQLATSQRLLATIEERRLGDLHSQAATVVESPTLKAALDTYHAERRLVQPAVRSQLLEAVRRELDRLATHLSAHVVAARDVSGDLLAVAGSYGAEWTNEYRDADHGLAGATVLTLPSGVFRAVTIPFVLHDEELGSVQLAQALDHRYVTELSALSGVGSLVVSDDQLRATTLAPEIAAALTPELLRTFRAASLTTAVNGEEYVVRPILQEGNTAVYMLDSVDAAARSLVASSLQRMGVVALVAFALATVASLWLARTIARPIDTLSGALTQMTQTRTFHRPLSPSGESREVDSLTNVFNTMMGSIWTTQAETVSAYLETTRAAMALDAREANVPAVPVRAAAAPADALDEFGSEGVST